MEGEGRQVNDYDYTDEDTHYTDDEDYKDEDYAPELETASKRQKRHTTEQIQELRAAYQQNDHPDEPTRRALGARIGLEARQVQYWFQNQRSQMQVKAVVQNSKVAQQENAALMAENVSLRQAILAKSCFTCGNAMVSADLPLENRRLMMENARLRGECMRATALLNKILRSAPPAERPPVVSSSAVAHRPAVLSVGEGPASSRADRAARLRGHAEAAMDQFLLLATKGEPLWLPTLDGDALSYMGYQKKALPMHHGFCPDGFVMEATRETGMVRASAAYLVPMLTDAKRWSEMFPGVVAAVTARSDAAISGGIFGSRIQLMNAELQVQSPCLLNRSINFLRYTKRVAEGQWAVMDVSVDGILGPPGSRIAEAANANNTVVAPMYTGCRLLPSGCLVEDMSNGYCKVTWVVHAEYDETTVPTMFRPLFLSGKALGAHRWLASLQRQCEYFAVLHSSLVPKSDNTAVISSMGKRGILELAQRMMAVFYSAVSGPVTQPSNNTDVWYGSAGTGAGARRTDAAVRMATWKKAGTVADLVLSASTTVWLPNTPPQHVFQYLCDNQRRGEWDAFANGAAVTELCSVATGHLHGNAVSILYSNVTDGTDRKKILILQQACTDASCSMVVYTPFEEDFMRAVMNGGDHASVFLLPSGFAVLPDGHGRARHAPSSSSTPVVRDNTAGSLVTVACQALLPGSSPSDNLAAAGAFDDVGNLLCRALKKIKAAVKANIVIPA